MIERCHRAEATGFRWWSWGSECWRGQEPPGPCPKQHLDRHLPIEVRIGGLIDLAHAPLTDEGGHVVMAESGADGQGHRVYGLVEVILPR